jgi:predicted nuclease of predicted toxin-antitoxin system
MIILLDLDGVLIPAKSWLRPEILNDGFPSFSVSAVNTLNKIINSQTKIVLTTSHKDNYTVSEWVDIFKIRGIIVNDLSIMPNYSTFPVSRRESIEIWCIANTEEFIIIDDDKSLNDLPINIKKNLIQTSSFIGLREENIEQLISK